MVLVEANITTEGKFRISGPGMETLEVELPNTNQDKRETFKVRISSTVQIEKPVS